MAFIIVFGLFPLDCPGQFSNAEALYCNKDCGVNWLDNEYGCQIDDADAYCRLKLCNKNATAIHFDVLPAQNQSGFACRGIGTRFSRSVNGSKFGYHGFLDFNYVDDMKTSHGEGNVVTNVTCGTNRSKFIEQIKFLNTTLLLNRSFKS